MIHFTHQTHTQTSYSGFTLIETMVAMTIASIIMAAAVASYMAQQNIQISQEQVVSVQQNLRAGMALMANDIRMAGCNPNQNTIDTSCAAHPSTATVAVSPGIHTATATQFGFSMDLDGDGDCSTNLGQQNENVTYNIYTNANGIKNLGRKSPTINSSLAEYIEAIEFLYTLKNGSQLLAPSTSQLDEIVSVQVSILGRTAKPDRNYTNTKTYIPASGTAWDLNPGPGVIPNDHFRRQLLSLQVNCRNMR